MILDWNSKRTVAVRWASSQEWYHSQMLSARPSRKAASTGNRVRSLRGRRPMALGWGCGFKGMLRSRDRKSTRLNSSHVRISYAVFCLKQKKKKKIDDE